jgi:YVTN family beta-propeller protein
MRWALICLLGVAVLNGCKPEKPQEEEDVLGDVYVLNQGGMGMNNASLSCYNSQTKALLKDCFLAKNKRGLGDVGNDLKAYGSKLYCVVNGSNTVEVMSVSTGVSVKQIPLAGKSPRRIAFWKSKAYICCWDGTVVQIDTASLAVEKTVSVGRNPEDLCVSNGKLYVSNSGGLDYPNYDNSVSVVDLASFAELKKIEVGVNPSRIAADDYGNVFVIVIGNYDDIPTKFKCISSQSDAVTHTFDLAVSNFTISGNIAYIYQCEYPYDSYWVKEFNVVSKTVTKENFFTEAVDIQAPYGITVNKSNGDVYIGDARDYKTNGDVHCFGSNGKKKFTLNVGFFPSDIVVVK